MTEEPDDSEKPVMLFGRDVSKIPCFRNSLLYGIGGGLGCGLIRFLFTSHTLKSINFSVYSFSVISLGYWFQCRYLYSKRKFEMFRIQEAMRDTVIFEGTEDEASIKAHLELDNPVEV